MNQYVTGAVIKGLREKHQLTQAELAKKLNISRSYVSRIEKRAIEKLSEFFS